MRVLARAHGCAVISATAGADAGAWPMRKRCPCAKSSGRRPGAAVACMGVLGPEALVRAPGWRRRSRWRRRSTEKWRRTSAPRRACISAPAWPIPDAIHTHALHIHHDAQPLQTTLCTPLDPWHIYLRPCPVRTPSLYRGYLVVKLLIPFSATVLPVHAGSAPRGSISEYGQAARADSCIRQEG